LDKKYLIQIHGEWSGIPEYEWMDIDMEADTLEEAYALIEKEVPKRVMYMLYDPWGNLLIEDYK